MDGSLGLQGTKPNFLGLADLGVGVGEGKTSGQKQDGSSNDLVSQANSTFCTSKINLQKSIAWNWDWNGEWWTSASAALLTLCPNKVSVKGCDFPYGTGTSSPLSTDIERTLCSIPLLLFSTLLAQLLSWYHIMHLAKQTFESRKSCVSICRLLVSGYLFKKNKEKSFQGDRGLNHTGSLTLLNFS